MRKLLFIILFNIIACTGTEAQYYDFTATAPSGQTLYCAILADGVGVTHPGWDEHNPWKGFDKPEGDLVIPDSVCHNGVTYPVVALLALCFLECQNLTSITLPPTLRLIERYAVGGCRGVRGHIIVPESVEEIDNYAFCCTFMSAVTLPQSLRKIGYSAFENCHYLAYISVPSGVADIGKDAFRNIPLVIYHGKAHGAPWGAAVLNGTTKPDYIKAILPFVIRHGGSGK